MRQNKTIIFGAIVAGILMTLFPPWQVSRWERIRGDEVGFGPNRPAGYAFIGDPPNVEGWLREQRIARLDKERLALQYIAVVLLAALASIIQSWLVEKSWGRSGSRKRALSSDDENSIKPDFAPESELIRSRDDLLALVAQHVPAEEIATSLGELGLLAVASCQGAQSAGKSNWSVLADLDVVILRDNDPPGLKYARDVARLIRESNPSANVRIIVLPGLPQSGDIIDFIDARPGKTVDELRAEILAIVKADADANPTIDPKHSRGRLEEHEFTGNPQAIDWLVKSLLIRGEMTLIAGNAGVNKTFLLCHIIACITRGWPIFGDDNSREPKDVIYIAFEDQASTIERRLMAAGADMSRVHLIKLEIKFPEATPGEDRTEPFSLQNGLGALEEMLGRYPDVAVIAVDPLKSALGRCDSNNSVEVRNVLAPLRALSITALPSSCSPTSLNWPHGNPWRTSMNRVHRAYLAPCGHRARRFLT